MITTDLIRKLVPPNIEAKAQIDELLKQAYIGIQNLRKMSLDKVLTLEYVKEVEQLFKQNRYDSADLPLPKYLGKYAQTLDAFWRCNYLQLPQFSRIEPFDLFTTIIENDLNLKVNYSVKNCDFILRRMEDYWIASNQLYTKYEISLIRKEYIR